MKRKTLSLLLVAILILSIATVAVAATVQYSGGANNSFTTGSINRPGTNWTRFVEQCTSSRESTDPLGEPVPHYSQVVNGGTVMSDIILVYGGRTVYFTKNNVADTQSQAQLKLSKYNQYFYAVGQFTGN